MPHKTMRCASASHAMGKWQMARRESRKGDRAGRQKR